MRRNQCACATDPLRGRLVSQRHCWNVFGGLDFAFGFTGRRPRARTRGWLLNWLGLVPVSMPILKLRFQSVLAFFEGLQSLQENREVQGLLIRHGLAVRVRI
jgi:hypothetical protein